MKAILYRFSQEGFTPYYQQFHAEGMELGLKHFNEKEAHYPPHLVDNIRNTYRDIIPEWKEWTTGVFSFLGKLPSEEYLRILLNHLSKSQREEYSWWTAEIDLTMYAFDVNNGNLWKKSGFKSIQELLENGDDEIYIPKQFLKVSNIQQWGNHYLTIFPQYENIVKPQSQRKKKY